MWGEYTLKRKKKLFIIFLVLANGESIQEASAYSGFFLRDSDPQTKTASNTDLLLERGSKKLSHSQSISLDSV